MTTYSVRAGDTLSAIASKFRTSVSALVKTNHLENPNLIMVGQRLEVASRFEPAAPKPKAQVSAPKPPAAAKSTAAGIPSNSRVAVIGDSHTAGTFGSSLKARLTDYLRKGGGKLTSFTGIPSASVSQFLEGGTTQAGSQTFRVPSLASILAKKPKVLTVALGTNMLFNSKEANKSQIRKLLAKADAAGTKVVWVGPPDVRGFSGELAGGAPEQRFYDALREVNQLRKQQGRKPMTIIDSRPATQEANTMDGVHFGGNAARTWARDVFQRATR